MIKFGTGGWRAVIGQDFICNNIRLVAAAIGMLAKEQEKTDKPVIIGYDRRFLSENAAKWVAETLVAQGLCVWFLHRSAPTPLIMHTVKDQSLHFGIEITASHNPAKYNGIKLIVDEGRDAPLEVTKRLEVLCRDIQIHNALYQENAAVSCPDFDSAVAQGKIVYLRNPFNRFLDDIISLLDMKALRERGLRVLFDSMHGSGTYPLQVIFHTARCTIDTINLNKDAYFGGMMPAPTEQTLGTLRDMVLRGDYDFGIAMDGDGDRLGIIDKNGRYINANEILCMLYYYLVKYKGWKGPAVRNVSTTHMLDRIAESFGEKCFEVPVGFKYISAKIDEVNAVIGGESSGGLTVRGHIHGKDSIYAASLFAEMVSVMGKSPSEIMEELEAMYGSFVMIEGNLSFPSEDKPAITRLLLEEQKLPAFSASIDHTGYEDGCKVYFADGSFVSCRFSGTEPLLRIFAEANTKAVAESYIAAFRQFLGI